MTTTIYTATHKLPYTLKEAVLLAVWIELNEGQESHEFDSLDIWKGVTQCSKHVGRLSSITRALREFDEKLPDDEKMTIIFKKPDGVDMYRRSAKRTNHYRMSLKSIDTLRDQLVKLGLLKKITLNVEVDVKYINRIVKKIVDVETELSSLRALVANL